MKTALIVSRHPAAIEFARDQLASKLGVEQFTEVQHLEGPEHADQFDIVAGVLPIVLTAALCEMGKQVYQIILPNLPPEKRGVELSIDEMKRLGARLVRVQASIEDL